MATLDCSEQQLPVYEWKLFNLRRMGMEHKVYERALATCVVMLLLSILLKVFGIQWLELNTNILFLNTLDYLVMNNALASFIYSVTFKFINGCLICMMITKDTKFSKLPLFAVCASSVFINAFLGGTVMFIFDTVSLYILCYKYATVKEYCLSVLLNILYQLISLFIRGLGVQLCYYPVVISVLLNLDYYILLVITYLYLKQGGLSLCLIHHHFGSFLASKLCKKPLNESSRNK